MEKRVTGIYFAVLLIGFLYTMYAAFSFHSHIDTRAGDRNVVTWDDQMEMTRDGDVYCYRRTLPREYE